MGSIPTMKYLTSTNAADVTGMTLWLEPDQINAWTMQVVTTGATLAGTFTFEMSNDPRARSTSGDTANAAWTDVTAALVQGISNPATTEVSFVATPKTGIPWGGAFLRMKFDNTAGTGTINAWFEGHSS